MAFYPPGCLLTFRNLITLPKFQYTGSDLRQVEFLEFVVFAHSLKNEGASYELLRVFEVGCWLIVIRY